MRLGKSIVPACGGGAADDVSTAPRRSTQQIRPLQGQWPTASLPARGGRLLAWGVCRGAVLRSAEASRSKNTPGGRSGAVSRPLTKALIPAIPAPSPTCAEAAR